MNFFWFLLLSSHLAISSSLANFKVYADNDLSHNQNGMHLNLYHVTDLDPSKKSQQFSYSEMFTKDEERVKYIHSRLSDKVSDKSEKVPKLVSTPLKSGLSINTGNYYVKIGLGTPANYFNMIVDTGSSLSWLQCKPCILCYEQVDPIFVPSKSKTYRKLPCSSIQCSSLKNSTLNDPSCSNTTGSCIYQASYGDSSFSKGDLSQDVLALNPSQELLPSFVYGCGVENLGLFGKASGLLGLSQDKLSMFAQLSKKLGYAFSYCLPTSFSSPNSTKEGFLSIGTSSLEPISSYKFTPLVKNPKNNHGLYFLDLTSVTVAGKPIVVSASSYKVPTIIDSGTVITRLPLPVYNALKSDFVKIMSKKYQQVQGVSILDTCYKGSLKDMLRFVPEIQMIFSGGAGLALRPQNVLIDIVGNGTTCLAFASSGMNPTNTIAIIGNFQQQTFKVAYDVANSKIGFAPGGCK